MQKKQTFGQWFKNLLLIDLLIGLATSGKHFIWKKFTVQYPEERLEPKDRFRGMFKYFPPTCNACESCVRACPINIIYVDWHWEKTPEGKRKKIVDRYDIDVKRCMFCGLCEEACPMDPVPIRLTTKSYESSTYERNTELYFDREKLRHFAGVPDPPYDPDKPKGKPKPKPAPKPAADTQATGQTPSTPSADEDEPKGGPPEPSPEKEDS